MSRSPLDPPPGRALVSCLWFALSLRTEVSGSRKKTGNTWYLGCTPCICTTRMQRPLTHDTCAVAHTQRQSGQGRKQRGGGSAGSEPNREGGKAEISHWVAAVVALTAHTHAQHTHIHSHTRVHTHTNTRTSILSVKTHPHSLTLHTLPHRGRAGKGESNAEEETLVASHAGEEGRRRFRTGWPQWIR